MQWYKILFSRVRHEQEYKALHPWWNTGIVLHHREPNMRSQGALLQCTSSIPGSLDSFPLQFTNTHLSTAYTESVRIEWIVINLTWEHLNNRTHPVFKIVDFFVFPCPCHDLAPLSLKSVASDLVTCTWDTVSTGPHNVSEKSINLIIKCSCPEHIDQLKPFKLNKLPLTATSVEDVLCCCEKNAGAKKRWLHL